MNNTGEIENENIDNENVEPIDPDAKVSKGQAKKEVESWLAAKRVPKNKRNVNADAIKVLVAAVMFGNVTIDPVNNFVTQTLTWPICDDRGNEVLLSLSYKPRLTVGEVQDKIKGLGGTAGSDVINATLSALTSQSATMLKKLDTEDYSIAQSVAVFFL